MNLKHKRLELLLNKELCSHDIPGLAVEVRHEGRSIFSFGLGIGDVSPRHFVMILYLGSHPLQKWSQQ
jgi:hypothetical protein